MEQEKTMEQEKSMEKALFLCTADREHPKRRAQYRYKTTERVQNRRQRRDEDGYFVPCAMFRPYSGAGLLCEVLGTTPNRRMADLRIQQEFLMKEAYEHEIEALMCQMRLQELAFHRRFCTEDRAEERYVRRAEQGERSGEAGVTVDASAIADANAEAPQTTAQDTRRVILNAVTWRYDWIQQYKKPCFQFAEAVIDCKVFPQKKRRGVNLAEQEQFRIDFIREAAAMPEPNRKLVDFMYETAWHILFEYRYGYSQNGIPEPWYDRPGNTDATKLMKPAESAKLKGGAETHEEDSDGESSCRVC